MAEQQQEESGKLAWFIAGAALGAAVGLLYAPRKGKEVRDLIGEKTDKAREVLSDTSKEVYERGRGVYEKGKQVADDAAGLFERGRRMVRGEEPSPGGAS